MKYLSLFNMFLCVSMLLVAAADRASADTFGSGMNTFDIEFVSIGNPGNVADTTGDPNPAGKVDYVYRMGKFEISEQMIDKANALGGIGITRFTHGPDKPATSISWNEAARFVNWLNTNSGSTPAYKFAIQPGEVGYVANTNIQLWTPSDVGYDPNNLYRNSLARYFLPSVNEWYKTAFYDPTNGVYYDYPTGSNSIPDGIDFVGDTTFDAVFLDGGSSVQPNDITNVGLLSPYGTAGQGGNVYEWEETKFTLVNNLSGSTVRGVRGGYWNDLSYYLQSSQRSYAAATSEGNSNVGFRIASSIPEPSTLLLLCFGGLAVLWRRRGAARVALLAAAVGVTIADRAAADTFGSGANSFDIEFVTIGNPGNAADTTGAPNPAGSVPYSYRMGKFEISEQMIDKANAEGGLGITKDARGADKPATTIRWNEAARFVNWLNTSSGSTPAYKFAIQPGEAGYNANENIIQLWSINDTGYNPNNFYRNCRARYFLPSVDEWYKAAYYDPTSGIYYDFPTGSNSIPDGIDFAGDPNFDVVFFDGGNNSQPNDITNVGLLSPYGTAGQGGNIREWEETDFDLVNGPTVSSSSRGFRGGYWRSLSSSLSSSDRSAGQPTGSLFDLGFRVASIVVPEPSTLLLVSFGSLAVVRRRRRLAYASVLVALLASPAMTAHAAAVRTVALSGQQAPGLPDGVNINSFFSAPVLNDAGRTAFTAALTGSAVGNMGIFSEGSGSLALVARRGNPAPGTPGGVNFFQLAPLSLVLNDVGQTAFTAALNGSGVNSFNDIGIWSERSGILQLVAREGNQAPGTPSGANFNSINLQPVLNNAGQIAFYSQLFGSGVDLNNNAGIWSEGSGSLALVARSGDQAPGTPSGVSFSLSSISGPPVLNDAGQTAFWSDLTGSGVDATNSHGIWSEGSGSLALVARKGDHAPGTPDGVNFSFLFIGSIRLNNAGQTAFGAYLTDGSEAIWSERSGSLALVARSGEQAPGLPDGVNFVNFGNGSSANPVLNNAGQTAFFATLTDSNSVWLDDAGSLTLVARSGDHAPGTPDGVNFISVERLELVLNNAGQIAFYGALTGNGVDDTNYKGIWATDSHGALQLIVREGDQLEVAPGDFRTIFGGAGFPRGVEFVGRIGNGDGRRSGFNDLGQLAFWARFTDGSSGIFVSNRVAVPEPTGAVMIMMAGVAGWFSRRRRRGWASQQWHPAVAGRPLLLG